MKLKFLVLAVSSLGLLYGQGERSALNGTVTDATGAAIPDVGITILALQTGVETKTTTTDAGVLPPAVPAFWQI